ncbi:MAG: Zn-dependent oligopeptidase [Chloroflexi bacterium]|nr:Zn-dependent oligopeptidase [Chloroflexota bacterium]
MTVPEIPGHPGLDNRPRLAAPPVWQSAAEVEAAFDQRLAAAESIRRQLLAGRGPRTVENTFSPFNDMLVEVDRVLPAGDLISNVHPTPAIREAAEKGVRRARKFLNDLRLDPGLYRALSDVPEEGLDAGAKRFRFRLLRDYRRSGVDREEATRQRLAALYERMVAAGLEFSRNLREDRRSIEVAPGDLAGLPADYVAAHPPGPDGRVRISTDYADYIPFLTYSPREDLRRELYFKFEQRAYPANEKVLKDLLGLRHESATVLGYKNWAAYMAEDKMVKTEEVIAGFLEQADETARPRMEQDLRRLVARKKVDYPGTDVIHEWDRGYYSQKVRSEELSVDSREVRAYFEFNRVKDGVLHLAEELFGVAFNRVARPEAWHPGVEAYDVFDGKELIGRFYLDLHPRPDKYSHVAVFHMLTGLQARQPSVIALVGNFPGPGAPDRPALLEHGEVLTFLHEFGHLMHHLLSGGHRWVTNSGFSAEWDFVETPSQLMEEWGWDAAALGSFARRHETGQRMPEELVQRMRQAEEFGKGLDIMRQVYFSRLSLTYHSQDPSNTDLLGVLKSVKKEYSPYPYEENTYTYANFGHLDEYSSMYYTYLWSRALEKDVFTVFQARGLMDKETARAYRRKVLEPGGAVDAADMLRDFLGRDYSFDAFRLWLAA